ncbi:hypothetical protein E4U17_000867 [Claviceps sp. LM77 group G4]|nr:hypothetical protein E4U17_000867 [Claviceps sp. LM77 group G4]KAG6078280.1 hypothetical protein E4U33_000772 [Claviceps sp. LM78 group G4]KAG6082186.1 hypothetical protein E4U16_006451 [Claviceps sp. LM84 group G4]
MAAEPSESADRNTRHEALDAHPAEASNVQPVKVPDDLSEKASDGQAAKVSDAHPMSQDAATITRIKSLLQAKDDTQRFVGLALLKSVLDNTPELRADESTIKQLWASVSPRFLDRLIATGSQPSGNNVREMLGLAVSVIYTFAALVPEAMRAEEEFTDRIPGLVKAVLYSSDATTESLLKVLHTLVSLPEGAKAFVEAGDVSSLAEIAPSHAAVLEIFLFAWLNGMASVVEKHLLVLQVASTMQSLVSAFTGTDGVTLVQFVGTFLRQADPTIVPHEPQWLNALVKFIRKLVTSRPNAAARAAYTKTAASLLQAYPSRAAKALFTEDSREHHDKPFAYLFINLLLIDIRSSTPALLQQLNQPDYVESSTRLASAFDVISFFIGYLVRCLEDDSIETFPMSPDSLLKLRKGISETMSITVEYLRDRWDATFAGAMGLHPDARTSNAETCTGSHPTLAWDSLVRSADEDPLMLSAVRALALWLREDDNETLRQEVTGLMDMFMELYQSSSRDSSSSSASSDKMLLDFRSPILVGLEALLTTPEGRDLFLRHDGWKILTNDLASLLSPCAKGAPSAEDAARGIEIVRALLSVAEPLSSGTPEEWMDIITAVAAWDVPTQLVPVAEFCLSVLQLCCTLLVGASPGMRHRYRQSMRAINGIVKQVRRCGAVEDVSLSEAMADVTNTMDHVLRGL